MWECGAAARGPRQEGGRRVRRAGGRQGGRGGSEEEGEQGWVRVASPSSHFLSDCVAGSGGGRGDPCSAWHRRGGDTIEMAVCSKRGGGGTGRKGGAG